MLQGYVKMLWRSGGSPVWSIIRLWDPLHVAGLQLSRCGWQQSRCLCLQLGLTSLAAVRKTFLRQFILKKPSKAGQMKQGLEMPVFLFLIDRVEFTCSVIVIQQQMEDTWPQISEQCFSFYFPSLLADTRRFAPVTELKKTLKIWLEWRFPDCAASLQQRQAVSLPAKMCTGMCTGRFSLELGSALFRPRKQEQWGGSTHRLIKQLVCNPNRVLSACSVCGNAVVGKLVGSLLSWKRGRIDWRLVARLLLFCS